MVGKTAICSLDTSSVWTDLEFGNSISLVDNIKNHPSPELNLPSGCTSRR